MAKLTKKFKVTKTKRYYIPDEIVEKALGFESLSQYILHLQIMAENSTSSPVLQELKEIKELIKSTKG